jgi:hypothetical protein
MATGDNATREYVIPAASFHFSGPTESYLRYDNHRRAMVELFEGSKKYTCAEDIKQDLMAMRAPIASCSTYDETARVAFNLFQKCNTQQEFEQALEGHLKNPALQGQHACLSVPSLAKYEVGRNFMPAVTEQVSRCYAVCAVAVAAVVCLACTGAGYSLRDPKIVEFPDYQAKS